VCECGLIDDAFDETEFDRAVENARRGPFGVVDRQFDRDRGVTRMERRQLTRQPIAGDRLANSSSPRWPEARAAKNSSFRTSASIDLSPDCAASAEASNDPK
jgi:hypothetical protein